MTGPDSQSLAEAFAVAIKKLQELQVCTIIRLNVDHIKVVACHPVELGRLV